VSSLQSKFFVCRESVGALHAEVREREETVVPVVVVVVGLRESMQAKEQAGERCERTAAAMHAPERNEKSMPPLLLSHLSLSPPLLFFNFYP
jgi:hypothetical protein